MARRFSAQRIGAFALAAVLALGACNSTSDRDVAASAPVATAAADPELVSMADAMQKTILEGAVTGAAIGGTVTIGGSRQSRSAGISLGGLLGASAGTYVALVQRRYAFRERRLSVIRNDLDENSEEIAATISVMRRVLAQQKAELAAIRARAADGAAPPARVAAELGEARANLTEMERAVDGAASRQSEFAEARGLVATSGSGSAIDPELAALSAQISEMRAIAGDLAGDLAGTS